MGFPNTAEISVIYNGTPKPPEPEPPSPTSARKNKFKWVLYAKKFRNRNKL